MEPARRKLYSAVLLGTCIYSLILWAYVVADTFLFPAYQFDAISAYVPLRQDILADLAFPVSFVCFVLWKYLQEQSGS